MITLCDEALNCIICISLISDFQLHVDNDIGVFMSDRYSYYAAEFLKTVEPNSSKTMDQFVSL